MNANKLRQYFQQGRADACDIAEHFAQGSVTPLDFTEACLSAAMASENIFITLTADRARQEAAASAARWQSGTPLSPLDGIPVVWKDLFDMRNTVTTAASATRLNAPPARQDAELVRSLAEAGMVSLGKVNLSEFAFSGLGINSTFGTPLIEDARGMTCIPGGSSSGSARAVAEGIACFGIGTDTAGSIRIPAAFSGLHGYRASRERYSKQGVYPLASSLDTLGPLCRSVRDIITLDSILTGDVPSSFPAPHFVADSLLIEQSTPDVQTQAYRFIEMLRDRGFTVVLKPMDTIHFVMRWIEKHGWPGAIEAFRLHQALLASPDADQLDPMVHTRLKDSGKIDPAVLDEFLAKRHIWQQDLSRELDGAVLIAPTVAHPAPYFDTVTAQTFGEINRATLRLTMPGSLLDLPGITFSAGMTPEGRQTSLLFSLPSGEDKRLLAAAQHIAAARA